MGKFNAEKNVNEKPYYASLEHIITKIGVPYDATAGLTEKNLSALKAKERTWDLDLSEMIPNEKISLFKGANHRFATLGHDPILGLIFGTGNIMTNTITCVKKPVFFDEMINISEKTASGIPFLRVDFNFWNGKIYIGEMTFYHNAGFAKFEDYKWDELLGSWIELPNRKTGV